ncbi:uracil-DNA glycosylase [Candidatus Nomurabacteria bacterium]|uniref:Uracil-DNA glycosylase n=1 Tax=candidate division WWE3 bacterium TaxID=2053526 RepID=A0A955IW90_UNCKA|nr:uracil-DNA glycosylase [candidate division WWE3 bacterium]MCB9823418.1 uracil-DNA glycosylase [Candidatus Nomurabacteria bacterium]MCB9827700.1 uracil-DNA glycosylase [Candidatus Nomurabacteria bacterium]HXK52836.1 uracil-DNA glycosylase [bacterium]
MDKVQKFLSKLSTTNTPENLFNPFNEVCEIHDLPNAPQIRLENVKTLLNKHLELGTKTVWLFEAPSYLGARRSGAPFVNEGMFEEVQSILGIEKSFQKATKTESATAMTSKMAWKVANEFGLKPLIWESLMFHPHKKGEPMTNRKPSKQEMMEYKHFLTDLLDMIKPERMIAVGRVAEQGLALMDIKAEYVRHPAQGGYREFRKKMRELYI